LSLQFADTDGGLIHPGFKSGTVAISLFFVEGVEPFL